MISELCRCKYEAMHEVTVSTANQLELVQQLTLGLCATVAVSGTRVDLPVYVFMHVYFFVNVLILCMYN